MIPLYIKWLLHIYAIPQDHEDCSRGTEAWAEFRDEMLNAGVIEDSHITGYSWKLTPRGHAYIESLLSVPLPICRWVTVWSKELSA